MFRFRRSVMSRSAVSGEQLAMAAHWVVVSFERFILRKICGE